MADDRTAQEKERAYALGVEAAELKAALKEHTRRLDAINGSIERSATESAKTRACVEELVSAQKTRIAVEKALAVTVNNAAARQVTTRTFVLGLVMMVISLSALYLGSQ